jgi:hypothetical protein
MNELAGGGWPCRTASSSFSRTGQRPTRRTNTRKTPGSQICLLRTPPRLSGPGKSGHGALGGADPGRVARQAGYGLRVETGRGAEPLEDDRHPSSWRSRSRSLKSTAAKPLQGREPRRRDAVIRTRGAEPGFQQEVAPETPLARVLKCFTA